MQIDFKATDDPHLPKRRVTLDSPPPLLDRIVMTASGWGDSEAAAEGSNAFARYTHDTKTGVLKIDLDLDHNQQRFGWELAPMSQLQAAQFVPYLDAAMASYSQVNTDRDPVQRHVQAHEGYQTRSQVQALFAHGLQAATLAMGEAAGITLADRDATKILADFLRDAGLDPVDSDSTSRTLEKAGGSVDAVAREGLKQTSLGADNDLGFVIGKGRVHGFNLDAEGIRKPDALNAPLTVASLGSLMQRIVTDPQIIPKIPADRLATVQAQAAAYAGAGAVVAADRRPLDGMIRDPATGNDLMPVTESADVALQAARAVRQGGWAATHHVARFTVPAVTYSYGQSFPDAFRAAPTSAPARQRALAMTP